MIVTNHFSIRLIFFRLALHFFLPLSIAILFMRYSTSLLSSLVKALMAVFPLCLLGGSCPSESAKEQPSTFHPGWHVLNDSEENLDKDKCLITKCGLGVLRFHVTDQQKCFNPDDFDLKGEKNNIVQMKPGVAYLVLTPNFYGSVTEEVFPKTMRDGMKYRNFDDKKGGIPLSFLEEWLAVDPIDCKDAILIIATGIEGNLGVSESLKKALRDKKEKGAVQDYTILRSGEAVRAHNSYVKEGKKVFTFIHTAG